MQTVQGHQLQSLRAVRDFLDAHGDRLADVVKTGAYRRLGQAIADLEADAKLQDGSLRVAKGATGEHRTLRRILVRDHMTPIARIAHADLPRTPQLAALRMPKGKPTPERLAAAAHGMGTTAGPFSETFVEAGMPQDFIAQLDSAADAMIAPIQARVQSRTMLRTATTGLRTRITVGRNAVKVLNAFVQTALRDEPALLSGWDLARRVRRPAITLPTAVTAPATAPVTAPVTVGVAAATGETALTHADANIVR